MTYRATPITQQDGSREADSNCRMASIATGLDYHTLGKKKSTGAKMRNYSGDPSGGTGPQDAKQAWQRGYSETLVSAWAAPWSEVMSALREGRLVHLDVWHATCHVCMSGTGRYGHTIAVAPERHSDRRHWLTSDPWCDPPKWSWVLESTLRAGAEEWFRRVRRQTGGDTTPEALEIAVLDLMRRFYPNGPQDDSDDPGDTGGLAPATMFTLTRAHVSAPAPAPKPPTGDAVGPTFTSKGDSIGKATVNAAGNIIATSDGQFHPVSKGYVRNVFEVVEITNGKYDGETAYLVQIPGGNEMGLLLRTLADYVPNP